MNFPIILPLVVRVLDWLPCQWCFDVIDLFDWMRRGAFW